MYTRVKLKNTNYKEIEHEILNESHYGEINSIYKDYSIYKGFDSVMPLFIEDIKQTNTEVIGYRNTEGELIDGLLDRIADAFLVGEDQVQIIHPSNPLQRRAMRIFTRKGNGAAVSIL